MAIPINMAHIEQNVVNKSRYGHINYNFNTRRRRWRLLSYQIRHIISSAAIPKNDTERIKGLNVLIGM